MIDLNATLVVQMINFALFLFILRRILFNPLVNHIQERRRYISSAEQKITQALAKIEESERNYQSQLDDARKNAQDLIHKNISMSEKEKQGIVQASVTETRNVFDEFRKELGEETNRVKTILESEVEILGREVARKVLDLINDEKLPVQGGNK